MEKYIIRYATENDIPAIMNFINKNWKKDHILSRDRKLFEWQYMSNKLDYILGLDTVGNIQGMLGFISYDDTDERDIATSMWKANEGCGFLGIKLLLFLLENEPHRTMFSPGINVGTSGSIYQRMGIKMGVMKQWYRLRQGAEYKIAKILDDTVPVCNVSQQADLILVDSYENLCDIFDFDSNVSKQSIPYKSKVYVERRYFKHPSYKYLLYGVKNGKEKVQTIIVLRVQECNGSRVIRFVDCIGDVERLAQVTNALDKIMKKFDAEYIDMYEVGVSDSMLYRSGWLPVKESGNIIPNYFSPYTQVNIDVNYCTTDENIVLFRGDGDQDRPN